MRSLTIAAIAIAAAASGAASAATFTQPLSPTSYEIPYPSNPTFYDDDKYTGEAVGGRYVGGLGDLTDGYINHDQHWYEDSTALAAVVGWAGQNPHLTFNFAPGTTFRSATLYFDDDNGHAAVYFPAAVTAVLNGVTYTADLNANDGPDATATFFFGAVTGSKIDFDIVSAGEWTMMTEATFNGVNPVPEPGEWAMLTAGLALVARLARKRRKF